MQWDEEKKIEVNTKGIRLLAFISVVVLLCVFLVLQASAHTHPEQYAQYTKEQMDWLRGQKVPNRTNAPHISCCNEVDAEEVQEDIRNGEYWIKGSEHAADGKETFYQKARKQGLIAGDPDGWVQVPQEVVISEGNKVGAPVVWWGVRDGKLFARCYSPGAKF